jgi:hypothetical protein
VVQNAVSGFGFAPEAAAVSFPVDLFLVGSDLTPVKDNIDKFINALTKWQPSIKEKRAVEPPPVTIQGRDFEDNLNQMNRLFARNRWGDGLPLLPATPERVKWILRGTDLAPGTRIGKILPRGRVATVNTLAVALALAGGRPEYLPVLIAAVEAMIDPGLNHQSWQATSCSVFPAAIVNGPIAKQIRLNSGFGLLGPDSVHPAGGAIGRALRLVQQNVGGAVPGSGTMAQFGGMRYTNAVFAEDEKGLPPGWKPLSVEYFGAPAGENVLTFYPVSGAVNILRRGTGKETAEEEALASLHRVAQYMAAPNPNALEGYEEGTPGILLFSTTVANQLAKNGWTKEKIKEFLWENSKVPMEKLKRAGMQYFMEDKKLDPKYVVDPFPISKQARNIMLVVAGGAHPTHAYWMQGAQASKTVYRKIQIPAGWDQLLKEAEVELGPLPEEQ